jgi:hypothetical protein
MSMELLYIIGLYLKRWSTHILSTLDLMNGDLLKKELRTN